MPVQDGWYTCFGERCFQLYEISKQCSSAHPLWRTGLKLRNVNWQNWVNLSEVGARLQCEPNRGVVPSLRHVP
jgi:hypothetical protein